MQSVLIYSNIFTFVSRVNQLSYTPLKLLRYHHSLLHRTSYRHSTNNLTTAPISSTCRSRSRSTSTSTPFTRVYHNDPYTTNKFNHRHNNVVFDNCTSTYQYSIYKHQPYTHLVTYRWKQFSTDTSASASTPDYHSNNTLTDTSNRNQAASSDNTSDSSVSPIVSNMKYVVVTGGVVSGLGKGISSSSIGVLLKEAGLHVTSIKIDPYLNIDAGTMSPYEHGEVYVLEDGGEVDLDLGNYERFLGTQLTQYHNLTTGKVYNEVLSNERRGDYLGKTVQVVPHVTNCIQDWIHKASHLPIDSTLPAFDDEHLHKNDPTNGDNDITHSKYKKQRPEVCMIELGGTVGDIESMVFLEAIRQFKYRIGEDNLCHVHVSLVPVVGAVGEPKSKPTQHSVKELRAAGLSPDIILCRSTQPIERDVIAKISMFCMVPPSHVISVHDVSNIYRVPLMLHKQGVLSLVLNKLKIHKMPPEDIPDWRWMADRTDNTECTVTIALVGKYTGLGDAYLSINKALSHAGIHNRAKVIISYIEAEMLQETWHTLSASSLHQQDERKKQYDQAWKDLKAANGILVPGGFGTRGVEGKILAAQYARENNIPFFGICLGFQVAVIEYARHVLKIENATSEEFDKDAEHPVIMFMPEVSTTHMGGTMRLGGRHSNLQQDTLVHQIYEGRTRIFERHRHRYEVNPAYIKQLQDVSYKSGPGTGLIFSGTDGERMETLELDSNNHNYFFGCQYHPEFTSRPKYPNPIFSTFVQAAAGKFERKKVPSFITEQHKIRQVKSQSTFKPTVITSSLPAFGDSYQSPSASASPSPSSPLESSPSNSYADENHNENGAGHSNMAFSNVTSTESNNQFAQKLQSLKMNGNTHTPHTHVPDTNTPSTTGTGTGKQASTGLLKTANPEKTAGS
jgi:CTP synthase